MQFVIPNILDYIPVDKFKKEIKKLGFEAEDHKENWSGETGLIVTLDPAEKRFGSWVHCVVENGYVTTLNAKRGMGFRESLNAIGDIEDLFEITLVSEDQDDYWEEDQENHWSTLKAKIVDGVLPEKYHKLADAFVPDWEKMLSLEENLEENPDDEDLLKALEKVSK